MGRAHALEFRPMLPSIADRRTAERLAGRAGESADQPRDALDPTGEGGPTVGLISLGCPKNLVDSEKILGALAAEGFVPTGDPAAAEVLLVNTCGFVEDAKQESIDTLLEMAEYKASGSCRYVVATGCLTQRYSHQLAEAMPEVDAWFGFEAYDHIGAELRALYMGRFDGVPVRVSDPGATVEIEAARLRLTPRHYAYLRISEGCDKTCSFCSIPSFRGRFRSKPLDAIVREAEELIAGGARELNLISQDTLHYGVDLVGKRDLARVVEALCDLEGLDWLRLWYLYPGPLPDGLREQLTRPQVVPYLDVPVQHADDAVLRAMRRPPLGAARDQLAGLRELIPGLVLRTTAIVGFPGETDAAFDRLLEFVEEVGFERLGAFVYSQEDGTPAAELDDQIPEELKLERHGRLSAMASQLVERAQRARLGGRTGVLIDGPAAPGAPDSSLPGPRLQGRSSGEGPDVDPVVFLAADAGQPGDLVEVELTELEGLDLVGRVADPSR